MLPAKYQPNLPGLQNISLICLVVLEKKIFEGFLPYMGMAAILIFGSKPF